MAKNFTKKDVPYIPWVLELRDCFLLVSHLTPLLQSSLRMCPDSLALNHFITKKGVNIPFPSSAGVSKDRTERQKSCAESGGYHIQQSLLKGAYILCLHPCLCCPLESRFVPKEMLLVYQCFSYSLISFMSSFWECHSHD